MLINREWAMPSSSTFSIKPIKELVLRRIERQKVMYANYNKVFSSNKAFCIVDPFIGFSPLRHLVTHANDLNPSINDGVSHLDALEFLQQLPDDSADILLFDPSYSPRQVSEVYKKYGKTVNMETTQSSYWSTLKDEITRVVKMQGIVITCAWNSGGIGFSRGFEIREVLLVAHGGWHNDTIVTVERKTNHGRHAGIN